MFSLQQQVCCLLDTGTTFQNRTQIGVITTFSSLEKYARQQSTTLLYSGVDQIFPFF
jgi:hypothetical protein